jgi:TolB-like protein
MIRGVLDELKERSVVRVAGLYAVAGWAVFQVVNGLFPALDMPPWTVSLAALLFLAGFPIAVILAWMFEMTPQGVKLVPRDRRRFGAGQFGWIDWLIGGVVVAVFAFAAFQLANLRGAVGERVASAIAGVPPRSVAVLPFVSFSELRGDGYFADGLTEELINSLAQSPELKVAGRTSSFYFKGRDQDLREVGRKLGVSHVVEGSVRRAGERLRVTAQLINVKDGFHLWSQTYDRNVDDALAIQTEVAEAVAGNLKAKLVGSEQPAAADNPDDYRAGLIARAQLRTQELGELRAARAAYAGLRERHPQDAAAHAGYAQATILLAQNFVALPFDQARREAAAAIERALAADPRSPDAWLARGAFERVLAIRSGDGSHHRLALAALRKAYELAPRDPETMILLARQLVSEGQAAQAIGLLNAALATDPLSRTGQEVLADALAGEGRFDEARHAFEALMSLYPDYTSGATTFAQMLLFKQGRLDEVVRLLDDPKLSGEDPLNALLLASSLANLGLTDQAKEAMDRIKADSPARPIAHAAELQLARRPADLLSYAMEQRNRTGDPIWGSVEVVGATLIGEYRAARAAIPATFPGVLKDPPDIAGYREMDVLLSATALQRTGSEAQARTILEAALHRVDGQPFLAADQLAVRAMLLAALGRRDEAIAAFERAARAGWRLRIDFDYFVPVEDYPFMAETARDPRFRKVAAQVDGDLARMREAVLKWRRETPARR